MRTSVTHPLRIDWLPVEGDKGCIGMTLCPGKKQPVSWTGGWDRQLDLDIESLKESGTTRIVSLVTDEDMELLQVTQLPTSVQASGIEWTHLPLPDTTVPTRKWLLRSIKVFTELQTSIPEGERVVVHCMGGLSRAGTFVAIYLYLRGYTMAQAIEKVRAERSPRCINKRQEEFLFELEENERSRLRDIQEKVSNDYAGTAEMIAWAKNHFAEIPVGIMWEPWGSGLSYRKTDNETWCLTYMIDHHYSSLSHAAFKQLIQMSGLNLNEEEMELISEGHESHTKFVVRHLLVN
jgi:protein-tyrosine phosphatase